MKTSLPVRSFRSQRRPDRFGASTPNFWLQLYPPEEAQNLPGTGVGGPAGRHPHHPGGRRHHFTRPLFLPASREGERR